jgi:hypothetical protein
MLHTMTYQLYTAADQSPADLASGEIAVAMRDLRLSLGRAFRRRHHMPPVRAAGTMTVAGPAQRPAGRECPCATC